MRAPFESSWSASLQQWLDRVARPIEFATRDECARMGTVTNLGTFVSTQVLLALADQVFPHTIEARLLSLRDLFADFQTSLPLDEQRRRLQEAVVILQALRSVVQHGCKPPSKEVQQVEAERCSDAAGHHDLWASPIRFAKGVGPKRTSLLQRWKIETVEDALWTVPWRYEEIGRAHV